MTAHRHPGAPIGFWGTSANILVPGTDQWTGARNSLFGDGHVKLIWASQQTPSSQNCRTGERRRPRTSGHAVGHRADQRRCRRPSGDAALVLAPGNSNSAGGFARLGADQISRMNLKHCQLAVLSACSVEMPEQGKEPASSGLATALLVAGVRSVLAPRWDLDSTVAVTYSRHFYEGLDRGDTAIRAASKAAQAIRANPQTKHPYFWAAYQFFGGD